MTTRRPMSTLIEEYESTQVIDKYCWKFFMSSVRICKDQSVIMRRSRNCKCSIFYNQREIHQRFQLGVAIDLHEVKGKTKN